MHQDVEQDERLLRRVALLHAVVQYACELQAGLVHFFSEEEEQVVQFLRGQVVEFGFRKQEFLEEDFDQFLQIHLLVHILEGGLRV